MDQGSQPIDIARKQESEVCALCSAELVAGKGTVVMACRKTLCSDCVLELVLSQGGASTVSCPLCQERTTLASRSTKEIPTTTCNTKPKEIVPSRQDNIRRKEQGLLCQFKTQEHLLRDNVDTHVKRQQREVKVMNRRLYSISVHDLLVVQKAALSTTHLHQDLTAAVASRDPAMLHGAACEQQKPAETPPRPAQGRSRAPALRSAHSRDLDLVLGRFLGEATLLKETAVSSAEETALLMCRVSQADGAGSEIQWITPYSARHTAGEVWCKLLCRGLRKGGPMLTLDTRDLSEGINTMSASNGAKDDGQVLQVSDHSFRRIHPMGWPKNGLLQLAKTQPRACLGRTPSGGVAVCSTVLHRITIEGHPDELNVTVGSAAFEVDVARPAAFDACKRGVYFAVVEAAGDSHALFYPSETREVKLFVSRRHEAVSTYRPADELPFCPSDVCFWEEKGAGGGLRLLVADWHRDKVHVLAVTGTRGLQFLRHLAASDLVKPSALNTDVLGGVWVGCSAGALLRFSKTAMVL